MIVGYILRGTIQRVLALSLISLISLCIWSHRGLKGGLTADSSPSLRVQVQVQVLQRRRGQLLALSPPVASAIPLYCTVSPGQYLSKLPPSLGELGWYTLPVLGYLPSPYFVSYTVFSPCSPVPSSKPPPSSSVPSSKSPPSSPSRTVFSNTLAHRLPPHHSKDVHRTPMSTRGMNDHLHHHVLSSRSLVAAPPANPPQSTPIHRRSTPATRRPPLLHPR